MKYLIILFCIVLTSCNGQIKSQFQMNDYFDADGEIFIKLYLNSGDGIQYWESWNTDEKTAVIHYGNIGDVGENKTVHEKSNSELKTSLNSLIEQKISEGFAELADEKHSWLTIEFKLDTWGTPEDLNQRENYRNIINEHLGWTGNGRCDDADIGSGTMNLFPMVVDPYLATKTIVKELKTKGVTESVKIGIEKEDGFEQIYPSLNE